MDESKEIELLQRLVLSWDSSEGELLALLEEIENWLDPRDEDHNMPLRRAVATLAKYQKLKTRRMDDHRMIKRLKDKIDRDDQQNAHEQEASKAIEASLLREVETLQTQLSATQDELLRLRSELGSGLGSSDAVELRNKLERYEFELEHLRPLTSRILQYEQELERLRHELERYAYPVSLRSNPLPPPPEPVSYGQLPSLAQAMGVNGRTNPNAFTLSSHSPYIDIKPTHTTDSPNGISSPYVNGTRTDTAYTGSDLIIRDKKGKGKERDPGPLFDVYSRPNPPPPAPVAILPGATPRQRVIPSPNPPVPAPPTAAEPAHSRLSPQSVDPDRKSVV